MTISERVVLYAMVLGLRPKRCLEVGTHKGGSAMLIVSAMDDIGHGCLVCVDSNPQVTVEHWQQIAHRAILLPGRSPDILPQAAEAAGGHFDLALIDGDHELGSVAQDIDGLMQVLENNSYLIFHDANYYQVSNAIELALQKYADVLVDCGMISTEQTPGDPVDNEWPVIWGGLRMLRYRKRTRE